MIVMNAKNIVLKVLLCTLILVSCTSSEQKQIAQFQKFTNILQTNHSSYTDAEWASSIEEYESILQSLENGRFTDAERQEIGRLKGICTAIYSKYAVDNFRRQVRGATKELEGVIEGLLEEFDILSNE